MKKIKVIGLGKLFQVIHYPNLIKYFSITSCCDPRSKLLNSFCNKFKINFSTRNVKEFLKTNNKSSIFICSSRASSFKILKECTDSKNVIFCEKPAIFNLEDARRLFAKLSYKKKIKFGYMTRYDPAIIFLHKYLIRYKKISKIQKIIFTLSNNSFYTNNKGLKYIRTSESNDFSFAKVQYPRFIKSSQKIMYHVFLNRYSHIINLVNFFFKDIEPISFTYDDLYNYQLKGKLEETDIIINCDNKNKYLFQVSIFLTNKEKIICKLPNPTVAYSSKITFYKKKKIIKKRFKKTNIFLKEVENLTNKNDYSATYLKDVILDLKIIKNFWKLIN